jgi:hypothetical protein
LTTGIKETSKVHFDIPIVSTLFVNVAIAQVANITTATSITMSSIKSNNSKYPDLAMSAIIFNV